MKSGNDQQGAALIVLVFIIALAATSYLLQPLNPVTSNIARDKKTAYALAEAKAALLGTTLLKPTVSVFGYLPNPDLGLGVILEGSEAGEAGVMNATLIGKLPWKNMGITALKDGTNECLWYAVSGRFKNNPKTSDVLNWDTPGQLDVIDAQGRLLSSNLAALVISPGYPLHSQNRQLVKASSVQCRGNYDAKNYLDPYAATAALNGNFNYFIGASNHSRALNANNKAFVQHHNADFNDRFMGITVEEMYESISQRKDFSAHIHALLDDADFLAHLRSISIAGTKGMQHAQCTVIGNPARQEFCRNWKEMLLLVDVPAGTTVTIDSALVTSCQRLLIFGGRKTGSQIRLTAHDKTRPFNYLEGANLLAFEAKTANGGGFTGTRYFDAAHLEADIMRCL